MAAFAIVHEENGVFGVSFPDFPGCIAGADTLEAAIQKAVGALALHIAGMADDGDAVPPLRNLRAVRRDPEVMSGAY